MLPYGVYTVAVFAAWYGLFKLPFAAPIVQRLQSTSYAVGFNNHVAVGALLTLIGVMTVQALRRRVNPVERWSAYAPVPVSQPVVILIALVYLVFTASVYFIAASAEWYGLDWESSHFLWRLKLSTINGLRPYKDYQFEYGPLLAYTPIALYTLLAPLGVSQEIAYYCSHFLLNLAGLFSLAFILSRAVMPGRTREIAFVALSLAAYLPNMGLNGVVLRYTAPFWGLVLTHDTASCPHPFRPIRLFISAFSGAALCIALSAEMGIAFLLVLIAYGACSVSDRAVVWTILAVLLLSLALAPALLPGHYYASLVHFSQGGNNLPLVITSPHLLLYLGAVIWFVPKWIAGLATRTKDHRLVFVLGLLTVTLIPGALGRCDPYHLMFYGLGLAMLGFVHLSKAGISQFRLYTVVYLLFFFFGLELINAWVSGITPDSLVRWTTAKWSGAAKAAVAFNPLLKYGELALPYGSYGYSKPAQQWLWSHKKVAPEYYMGGMGIYSEAQMTERLRDIGRFPYALIHASFRMLHKQPSHEPCVPDWRYMRKALLYPWRLPCIQPTLDPDGEISRYLETDYRVVEKVDSYLVLKKFKREVPVGREIAAGHEMIRLTTLVHARKTVPGQASPKALAPDIRKPGKVGWSLLPLLISAPVTAPSGSCQ